MNNIIRKCYAMSFGENDSAEIEMYGVIVESIPVDWWTGEQIPGEYIVQSEFLTDLDSIIKSGVKNLTIRMNSIGGDAVVATVIHNRIRELADSGVSTVCIIDGVAESGGSLIACSCDKVIVNTSSLFMMHKCWTNVYGGYNSDDLRSLASALDATDKQQVAIYKRKCGKSETEISHLMGKTTFLVGQEIIDKGFADELNEGGEKVQIAASADKRFIFANGHRLPVPSGAVLPEFVKVATPEPGETIKNKASADTDGNPKEENIMATNFAELRAENPELAATVEQEIRTSVSAENNAAVTAAVQAERTRIQEIDEVSGYVDADLIRQAKYENPCTRAELADRAILAAAKAGRSFLTEALADNASSGANSVGASPEPNPTAEGTTDIAATAKKSVADYKKIMEEAR